MDTANPLLFALAELADDAKDATTRRAPRDATVVVLADRRVVVVASAAAAAAALRVTADIVLQSNKEEGRSFRSPKRMRATECDADAEGLGSVKKG